MIIECPAGFWFKAECGTLQDCCDIVGIKTRHSTHILLYYGYIGYYGFLYSNILLKNQFQTLFIENRVSGWILFGSRVLYMAGSLRYLWIEHPLFNVHLVQCKNSPYANSTHFSHVEYVCLQYKVVLKAPFETLV